MDLLKRDRHHARVCFNSTTSVLMLKYVLFLILIVLPGCCSSPAEKEIALFRHKHPAEFRCYTYLQPASMTACGAVDKEDTGYMVSILSGLEQRYANISGLTNFTERAIQCQMSHHTQLSQMCDAYNEMATNGATVFYFHWTNGKWFESGFVALKNGEIVKRGGG